MVVRPKLRCGQEHSPYCFYCDMPLGTHEHDHFPVPKGQGGEATVPCCINCHDLKDRVTLDDWPLGEHVDAWQAMPPIAKIFLAKVYRLLMEGRHVWASDNK